MTDHVSLPQHIIDRQTLARPALQWAQIFREQTDFSDTGIAARILGDLWGYKSNNRYQEQDIVQLAKALRAMLMRPADLEG